MAVTDADRAKVTFSPQREHAWMAVAVIKPDA